LRGLRHGTNTISIIVINAGHRHFPDF